MSTGASTSVLPGPWKDQARLLDATDRIRGAMEQRDPSYTGIIIDPDSNILTLYVHGTPSAASQKVLDAEKGRGYRLDVSQAPYSRAKLNQSQDKLWRGRDTLNIESVVGKEDGTGLVVGVPAGAVTTRLQLTDQPTDQKLSAVAGVPVATEQGGVAPMRGTRQADGAAFWGGASIFDTATAQPAGCTSSFGVAIGTTTYMVTAGHCGKNGDLFMSNSWKDIGKMTWNGQKQGAQVDAALIKASVGGYIYDGAYNNGNGYRKPVAGYSRPAVGMYVCTSGSQSGVICNIKVTYMGKRMTLDGYSVVSDVAEQVNHTTAGGKGDSGAPVFTVTSSDNFARMTVVGTLSSGLPGSEVGCQGVQGRTCYWGITFARFDNLRIQAGITRVLTAAS